MRTDTPIPVTALTGFLGSGKTTLVNQILTSNHGLRIAVIENEFGEIAIDDALVLNGDEKIIEMSNGCCLCCTARTDLIEILHSLLERREKFDRIVIETSGMADPNPVAQTFFVDDEIAANFELDAIVTMVDARHVGTHLDEVGPDGVGDHVIDQIAFADRIILNKIDLVPDEEELSEVQRRLRGINSTAEIIRSEHANVDLSQILGIGAFDLTSTLATDPGWLDEGGEHLHDPSLSSVGIEMAGELDQPRLAGWLANLVQDRGADLYRLKGLLAVRDDDRRFVLQGIHEMYDLSPAKKWDGEPRASKIVFIGRSLDRAELTRGLESCLAS